MKTQHILLTGLLLGAGAASAQTGSIYAGEAFRYSDIQQTGTARFRGLGGNQTALGGDASNLFGNPAGLGFYNRSEFSISPTVNVLNTQSNYIGSSQSTSGNKFSVRQLGLVFAGGGDNGSRWRRSTFGIGYHQNINFFNPFSFQGRNNRSSFIDPIAQEATSRYQTGNQINGDYDTLSRQAFTLPAAAWQLYLIDGTPVQGSNAVNGPFRRADIGTTRTQLVNATAVGSQGQWTLAYAGNLDDKLYIGANLGLSTVRYTSDNTITENGLNSASYDSFSKREQLSVRGTGFNLTVGAIYKLTPELQLGATVSTPTLMSIRETFSQGLSAVVRDPQLSNILANTGVGTNVDVQPNDFNYRVTSPFRATGGATYFLGQGKIGFITATAEYVGYSGLNVSTSFYNNSQDNSGFKNDVRTAVQSTYQNVVNVRGGAEVRAGLFRLRAGVAYLPDPFVQQRGSVDQSRLLLSGGVGVRNERYFADLGGTFATSKSAYTPYTLPNATDYASAQITNKNTNITLSVGTFF